MPLTVVPVPTVVPPVVHVVGAVAWGPKTVKVTVPVAAGVVVPPARTELMLAVAMAVPAVPVPGPAAVTVGENLATTVSDMVGATGRGRRVVVGVAAVGGVPPVVTGTRAACSRPTGCRWRCR